MNDYRGQVVFRPVTAVCIVLAAAVATSAASSEIGEKAARQTPQPMSPTVSGIVLDEEGKTVEGAFVKLGPEAACAPARTGPDGRFALRYKPTGWRWPDPNPARTFVIAWHVEKNLAAAVLFKGDWRKTFVEVRMRPAASLAGRVVDVEGKGIPDAQVTISFRDRSGATAIEPPAITSDRSGRYEAPALPAGFEYMLGATADGYGDAYGEVSIPEASSLSAPVEAEDLVPPVANLSVSGLVVRPDGTPAGGVFMSAAGDAVPARIEGRDALCATDDDGRFTIDGLTAGSLYVYAAAKTEALRGNATVDAGSADFRIVLKKATSHVAPPAPKSLIGTPLPDLSPLVGESAMEAEGKAVLVCFFDFSQRASKRAVSELAARADLLSRNSMFAFAVDVSATPVEDLAAWTKEHRVPFITVALNRNVKKTHFDWGIKGLPWLILTDADHIVRAEGFAAEEFEEKLNEIASE